jgi:hypothetical protein
MSFDAILQVQHMVMGIHQLLWGAADDVDPRVVADIALPGKHIV